MTDMRKYILLGVLCASLLTASVASIRITTAGGGGGTTIADGVNIGDVPVWDGSVYAPGTVSGSAGLLTANADLRYAQIATETTANANTAALISTRATLDAMATAISVNGAVSANAISIGGDRRTAWPTGGGSSKYMDKKTYQVVDTKFPVVDTTVSGAALSVASGNNSIDVALMSATVTQGRLLSVYVPNDATIVTFSIWGKPITEEAAAVHYYVYSRVISTNADITGWTTANLMISSFAKDNFWTPAVTGNLSLNYFGWLPGNMHQVLIARGPGSADDSLTVTQQVQSVTIEME